MRFGQFCLPTYIPELDGELGSHMRSLIDFAAQSDELGFDSVWANEHHFAPYGGLIPSPPVFLAALAQRTKRVRLGTSIVMLSMHNPIEIAEQLAMVDLMSGGRLELGVGRGFIKHDYDVFGVPLDEAQGRTLEGLEVVLKAWRHEPLTHHGQHFHFDNVDVWPKPQQDRPPAWLGCTRTPESFAYAARQGYKLATITHLNPFERLAELCGIYRRTWVACGRDPSQCEIATHYQVVLDEDRRKAREMAIVGNQRSSALNAAARAVAGATNNDVVDQAGSERLLDEGRLIGCTPDECVDIFARAQDGFGLTEVHAKFMFGGLPLETAQHSLALFAREVIPRLRDRRPAPLSPAGAVA